MNELVEYAQSIISFLEQNGSSLNIESQQALGQLLQNILQVIEQQQNPVDRLPPNPPGQEGLTQAMPSSNVEGFAYDDKTGNLFVRFLGKHPNREGPVYQYGGVPRNIFEIFQKGAIPAKTDGKNKWGQWWKGKYPSIGAAMYHVIRAGGYPYVKLT